MNREQPSVSELLLSLDSLELQEAEQVRAAINQQLSTDRGGAVLSGLVEHYLDSSSSQVLLLLLSIREAHHKLLFEKLNEALGRSDTRLAGLTLLGHLIRKQPPWVHHIRHSVLLPSLLRCLKTDTDVVVLVSGVLVLVTLLPMIPQAGKRHIYDFFDVFGRLASWSYRNPGQVEAVYLVHLRASIYSLFHRLYGMYPCNFLSYLRLHYSMKENLDTFQEVVKPMLDQVRVHPELVTGAPDDELDPSRWRRYEVHDILIECSRVSLDPLESSNEDDGFSRPHLSPSVLPHTDAPLSPHPQTAGGASVRPLLSRCFTLPLLTPHDLDIQADDKWSPSAQCGLSTPPPEPSGFSSAHPLSRTASVSGVKLPSPQTEENDKQPKRVMVTEVETSAFQPITAEEARDQNGVITNSREEVEPQQPSSSSSSSASSHSVLLTAMPSCDDLLFGSTHPTPPCSTSSHPSSTCTGETDGSTLLGPAHLQQTNFPPYEHLFELALPTAAMMFMGKKNQEVLQRAGGEQEEDTEDSSTSHSPLEILDQLIAHGNDAHEHLSRRLSAVNKSTDRSHFGGKQQSMKSKGSAQGEELQAVRSQLLLLHSELQYERFKRQQHAVRNRRLLRKVINATTLEEQSVAMKDQLSIQDEEICSLKESLDLEQQRYTYLQEDTHACITQLKTHIAQLLLQLQNEQRTSQRLQSELQECHRRLRDLEAKLQKSNNKAYNAEHNLTQLSLKLCSSEALQQQLFMLDQQLILLRETNRMLTKQLEEGHTTRRTEASMLQCTVGKEFQRLKDSEVQQRQKLEAANHRIAELENQVTCRDQLLLDQKKLLEDTKTQSRAEQLACESRCVALKKVTQALQTEMLHLYSKLSPPQEVCNRPNGDGVTSAAVKDGLSVFNKPCPSSSVGIINGSMELLSTSSLHHPFGSSSPFSLSPINSPPAVGSFLEQQAWQLFTAPDSSQEEEAEHHRREAVEEVQPGIPPLGQEVQPGIPPLGQEVEEETLLTGSLQTRGPAQSGPPALSPDQDRSRHRRPNLSIMDYDETESES